MMVYHNIVYASPLCKFVQLQGDQRSETGKSRAHSRARRQWAGAVLEEVIEGSALQYRCDLVAQLVDGEGLADHMGAWRYFENIS